ncbi:MAG: hypothetical protein WC981_03090, partial [Candidatus Dojkabacteria bacterium]
MKRFLSLVLAMVMIFSISIITYAEDSEIEGNVIDELDPNVEMELSLEQAIEYALEHSRDMKIQDLDMKRAELKYDQDRKVVKDYNKGKDYFDYVESLSRIELEQEMEKGFIDSDI